MYSFPWNAELLGKDEKTGYPILDRTAGADDLRLWIKALMTDGVHLADADAFVVTASEGMKVLVSPGMCIVNGSPASEPNTRELSLQASASQDRIDTIVIRWDNNRDVRTTDLYVKTGVASDTPVRPTLTRTDTIYELGIDDVYIPANSTSVSQERITDTRLESERCGMVTAILDIDTTTFFNQLQAATDKAVELANSALEGTIAGDLQANKVSKSGDTMTGALTLPYTIYNKGDANFEAGISTADGNNRFVIYDSVNNRVPFQISQSTGVTTLSTYPVIAGNVMKDQIIAEGDSGIWHYIKYASGWAECWTYLKTTINQSASPVAWAQNLYQHTYAYTYTYPFNFTSIPKINDGLEGYYDAGNTQSPANTIIYKRFENMSNSGYSINYYAITAKNNTVGLTAFGSVFVCGFWK